MNYRKLEVFREVRLWITTIVVPLAITTTLIVSNQKFKKKISELKNPLKRKKIIHFWIKCAEKSMYHMRRKII